MQVLHLEKGQASWTDISLKRIYRWQINTWNGAHHQAIREMQTETKVIHSYTNTRMTKMKMATPQNAWRDAEMITCWWLGTWKVHCCMDFVIKFAPLADCKCFVMLDTRHRSVSWATVAWPKLAHQTQQQHLNLWKCQLL